LGDGDKKSIYSYTLNLDVNKPYLQRFFMDGGFPAIENYYKCIDVNNLEAEEIVSMKRRQIFRFMNRNVEIHEEGVSNHNNLKRIPPYG
jgi:hypothetical protein